MVDIGIFSFPINLARSAGNNSIKISKQNGPMNDEHQTAS